MYFPLYHTAFNTETKHQPYSGKSYSLNLETYSFLCPNIFKGQNRKTTNFLLILLLTLLTCSFKNTIHVSSLHLQGKGVNPGKWVTSELHWDTSEGMSHQVSIRHRNNVANVCNWEFYNLGKSQSPNSWERELQKLQKTRVAIAVRNLVFMNSA